jgi:ubiquinone/menaquinone biosynthesis C-methylase UbiE
MAVTPPYIITFYNRIKEDYQVPDVIGSASKKDQVKKFFSTNAKAYAAGYRKPTADLARLIQLLSPQSNWRVVDVGAGTGRISAALAPFVTEVTAVDLTPAMETEFRANIAAQGLHNVRFLLGDAEALPLPSASADLVTCARAAHHFPAIERAVGEMARVLRPGGALGFIDMTTPEDPAAAELLNTLERVRDTSHVCALSPSTWLRILTEQGFAVDICEVQEEEMSLSDWLLPVAPDAETALQIMDLAAAASATIRRQVFSVWEPTPVFLKQRVVISAHKTS